MQGFDTTGAGNVASVHRGLDKLLLTLTYSMARSLSREANRFSASQEIPRILWKPEVHYCIQKLALTLLYPEISY